MSQVFLTRVVRFSAAHRYHRPEWSAARNQEVFGPCANEHGHGHNYTCHVTVAGPLDAETAMVINLTQLDGILREEVFERFDHRHLNYAVPEFADGQQIPTGEALAVYIWKRVVGRLPKGVHLHRVRIQEDPNLYVEYDGSHEST